MEWFNQIDISRSISTTLDVRWYKSVHSDSLAKIETYVCSSLVRADSGLPENVSKKLGRFYNRWT